MMISIIDNCQRQHLSKHKQSLIAQKVESRFFAKEKTLIEKQMLAIITIKKFKKRTFCKQ